MIPGETPLEKKLASAPEPPEDDGTWYEPGQVDPASGEKISALLYQTKEFVVTIDSVGSLNWTAKGSLKFAHDFGAVESKIALSENLVERLFSGNKNKLSYKKMLGTALARLLSERKSAAAAGMLNKINARILEHGRERVRMAYIMSALWALAVVSTCLAVLIIWGGGISARLQVNTSLFQGLACIFLGGIGAFISAFFRFKDYKGSLVSGLPIHRLDGALRIVYGMVAGLFLCLAVRGNIIAGFAAESNLIWIMYFLAMVAGASEIFVPNLIRQTETQVGIKPSEGNTQGGNGNGNGDPEDSETEPEEEKPGNDPGEKSEAEKKDKGEEHPESGKEKKTEAQLRAGTGKKNE